MLRPSTTELRHRNFDATEALLIAQGTAHSPTSQWSTAALLMTLLRVVRSQPYHADGSLVLVRQVDGTSALAFLGQRGVDPRRLMVQGFGRLLLFAIDSSLGLADLEGAPSTGENAPMLSEWQRLRRGIIGQQTAGDTALPLSKSFRDRLKPWIATSDICDLLDWTPPTEIPEISEPEPDADSEEFLWFVERFTQTYLTEWTDASLALEYRYTLDNWHPRSLPSELLLEREIGAAKVCHEISSRTVHSRPGNHEAKNALVQRALEAIDKQRRDIAAAIFTSARTLDPKDAMIANNLGFCLIPDQPEEAIKALAEAQALGETSLLNTANSAAAHYLLGDLDGALLACSEALKIGLEDAGTAWLWPVPLPDEPKAVRHSLGSYICDLAILAATEHKDLLAVEAWRTRRGYMQNEPDADS
jgi:tetratricopeptide (TPR) repeat protein